MNYEYKVPKEGDLHSIVKIEDHTFELRYGYYEEADRCFEEPFVIYPDLFSLALFTKAGYRIVSAIQSVCENYKNSIEREKEDCCYTCQYYLNAKDDIAVCKCEKMKKTK